MITGNANITQFTEISVPTGFIPSADLMRLVHRLTEYPHPKGMAPYFHDDKEREAHHKTMSERKEVQKGFDDQLQKELDDLQAVLIREATARSKRSQIEDEFRNGISKMIAEMVQDAVIKLPDHIKANPMYQGYEKVIQDRLWQTYGV